MTSLVAREGKNWAAMLVSMVVECALGILAADPTEETAIAIRDEHPVRAGLDQLVHHLLHADVRPISRGARVHNLLDGRVRVGLERLAAEVAHYDSSLVHDHAEIICHVQLPDTLPDSAGCDVAMRDVADAQLVGELTFTRQAGAEPIDLARGVAIYLCVPEGFEPPRGSCAQVSIAPLAVCDDRTVLVGADEPSRRVGPQLAQGQANRAGQVLVLELLFGKNLHDRGSLRLQLPDAIALNVLRHANRACARAMPAPRFL
jgi:hypothetical protein